MVQYASSAILLGEFWEPLLRPPDAGVDDDVDVSDVVEVQNTCLIRLQQLQPSVLVAEPDGELMLECLHHLLTA